MQGVVELLVSWQGKFSKCSNAEIWSIISLMWGYLLGEKFSDF